MNDAQGAIGSANNISMPCNQLLLHCIIFFTVKDQLDVFIPIFLTSVCKETDSFRV
jgi:hypothetical protein